MKLSFSLQTRFIVIFGAGSILLALLVVTIVFTRMQTAMISQLEKQYHDQARHNIAGLRSLFEVFTKRLIFAAELPMFRTMRYHQLTLNDTALQTDIRQLELYFLELEQAHPEIKSMRYINVAGREIFRVEHNSIATSLADLSQDSIVQNAMKITRGNARVTTFMNNDQIKELIWWVPVFASPKVRMGVLAFHVPYEYFLKQLNQITDLENEFICLSDSKSNAFIKGRAECNRLDLNRWSIMEELGIPGLNWSVTLSTYPDTFLDDVKTLRWWVFAFILPLIAILAFVTAVLASRNITNPIIGLVSIAQKMGAGEEIVPAQVNRADELGLLEREFYRASKLIQDKTRALTQSNRELESYSYSIAHDLRAPLRSIVSFSQILAEDAEEKLNKQERDSLQRVIMASKKMSVLIDDILELSRISRLEIDKTSVNLSDLAQEVATDLTRSNPERRAEWKIADDLIVYGDPSLLHILLENLLSNAWKYTSLNEKALIEFNIKQDNSQQIFYVRDNGVGFNTAYMDKLFKPFSRLHVGAEFEGTGIGLATAQRVIQRHGGTIWADAEEGKYAAFYFTLA